MNRRTFLKSVPALTVFASANTSFADDANEATVANQQPVPQAEGVIKLNPPDLNKGISLMQALKKRKTNRDISDKKLTLQQLSDLLWAADGVNRPDGKRTAPAAKAVYSVNIYVVLPEAVYLYDVAKHQLTPVAKGDFRKSTGAQDFIYIAPVNLVYVLNAKSPKDSFVPNSRDKYVEVGCLAQNVYLYCTSQGLAATARGGVDQKKFSEVIKAKPEQIALAQTIGYPK
jgi:SagB-type dehydrogenase family enzyme